jgi:hypothetical protein|tara:strand:- start:33 stop:200 length:168 start_codon:yes stop_codon:yes gene_type:complete
LVYVIILLNYLREKKMSREWNGSCEDWLHGDEHLSDSCDSEFENSEEDKEEKCDE